MMMRSTSSSTEEKEKKTMASENHLPNHNRLITIRMVADECGLSEQYVQTLMREGKIPCIRIGQKYRMTQDQWNNWLYQLQGMAAGVNHPSQVGLSEEAEASSDEELSGEEPEEPVSDEEPDEDLF